MDETSSTRPREGRVSGSDQERLNAEFWARGETVDFYATRELRQVETTILERHRAALAGGVLELGCGAGRLTGHLCQRAEAVHGLDLSRAMVEYCRHRYPSATFSEGDLRDLSRFDGGSFDAVFASFNVLDVLGDVKRRRVLDDVRHLIPDGGLLIMSSHNRSYVPRVSAWIRCLVGSPRQPWASLANLPRRVRNRRRLRRLEREEESYALVNDEAHDFSVLHYYVTRDAQARQLAEAGFELIECLDLDGREVPVGAAASHCPELHYVARALA